MNYYGMNHDDEDQQELLDDLLLSFGDNTDWDEISDINDRDDELGTTQRSTRKCKTLQSMQICGTIHHDALNTNRMKINLKVGRHKYHRSPFYKSAAYKDMINELKPSSSGLGYISDEKLSDLVRKYLNMPQYKLSPSQPSISSSDSSSDSSDLFKSPLTAAAVTKSTGSHNPSTVKPLLMSRKMSSGIPMSHKLPYVHILSLKARPRSNKFTHASPKQVHHPPRVPLIPWHKYKAFANLMPAVKPQWLPQWIWQTINRNLKQIPTAQASHTNINNDYGYGEYLEDEQLHQQIYDESMNTESSLEYTSTRRRLPRDRTKRKAPAPTRSQSTRRVQTPKPVAKPPPPKRRASTGSVTRKPAPKPLPRTPVQKTPPPPPRRSQSQKVLSGTQSLWAKHGDTMKQGASAMDLLSRGLTGKSVAEHATGALERQIAEKTGIILPPGTLHSVGSGVADVYRQQQQQPIEPVAPEGSEVPVTEGLTPKPLTPLTRTATGGTPLTETFKPPSLTRTASEPITKGMIPVLDQEGNIVEYVLKQPKKGITRSVSQPLLQSQTEPAPLTKAPLPPIPQQQITPVTGGTGPIVQTQIPPVTGVTGVQQRQPLPYVAELQRTVKRVSALKEYDDYLYGDEDEILDKYFDKYDDEWVVIDHADDSFMDDTFGFLDFEDDSIWDEIMMNIMTMNGRPLAKKCMNIFGRTLCICEFMDWINGKVIGRNTKHICYPSAHKEAAITKKKMKQIQNAAIQKEKQNVALKVDKIPQRKVEHGHTAIAQQYLPKERPLWLPHYFWHQLRHVPSPTLRMIRTLPWNPAAVHDEDAFNDLDEYYDEDGDEYDDDYDDDYYEDDEYEEAYDSWMEAMDNYDQAYTEYNDAVDAYLDDEDYDDLDASDEDDAFVQAAGNYAQAYLEYNDLLQKFDNEYDVDDMVDYILDGESDEDQSDLYYEDESDEDSFAAKISEYDDDNDEYYALNEDADEYDDGVLLYDDKEYAQYDDISVYDDDAYESDTYGDKNDAYEAYYDDLYNNDDIAYDDDALEDYISAYYKDDNNDGVLLYDDANDEYEDSDMEVYDANGDVIDTFDANWDDYNEDIAYDDDVDDEYEDIAYDNWNAVDDEANEYEQYDSDLNDLDSEYSANVDGYYTDAEDDSEETDAMSAWTEDDHNDNDAFEYDYGYNDNDASAEEDESEEDKALMAALEQTATAGTTNPYWWFELIFLAMCGVGVVCTVIYVQKQEWIETLREMNQQRVNSRKYGFNRINVVFDTEDTGSDESDWGQQPNKVLCESSDSGDEHLGSHNDSPINESEICNMIQ